ncbi:metal ABC transporter solute-binding protein, Zn/Mn family [Latilactobacillus fuchuensis]|uniref:Zinc/iron ABC transporter substrate-binding n=1 Tax=Latilactobacillus fuchuensis TaxID=164393 RepID=A0A2N9DYD3_9LACO|nr:zinc ABC transporter substrate-binding protein [Latilactobacillus fuchuensis]SPC40165.1 Zinc/iron ABC transporter substrate-binding [Latilactobacillus fuchuensis]
MHKKRFGSLVLISALIWLMVGCAKPQTNSEQIQVVSSLDFYGEAAQAVLGQHGQVTSIINSPSLDPHSYEPTTKDAKAVAQADVVIENGLGYDQWLAKVVAGSNSKTQKVIQINQLMNRTDGANEHLWYDLKTMPKLTRQLIKQFSQIDPTHKKTYQKNGQAYLDKLTQLQTQLDGLKAQAKGQKVAVSEPVFNYALTAMGYQVANSHFAKAIEDGTDPSPKDIAQMRRLIKQHEIAFLVVNKQEESPVIQQMHELAKAEKVPVVQVTETLPAKETYLTWMQQQFKAVRKAQNS